MTRIRYVAFIALAPFLFAGCAGTADNKSDADLGQGDITQVITLEGYPLDRSRQGLKGMRGQLDYLAIVQAAALGSSPHWTTPDGSAPAFIDEGRAPRPEEGLVNLVTSVDIRPISATKNSMSPRTMSVVGGSLDGVKYVADSEVAPALEDVKGLLLVGGAVSEDGVLDPWFVYSVDDQGKATSLIDSADVGDVGARPSFMLEDLDPGLKLP
jgi:hypothetical protein